LYSAGSRATSRVGPVRLRSWGAAPRRRSGRAAAG
jgi:hypothetical protein